MSSSAVRRITHPTTSPPCWLMYAECTQTRLERGGPGRTLVVQKWSLTCVYAEIFASRSVVGCNVAPAHNPEVVGSNPTPDTCVSAGERPFPPSGREGLLYSMYAIRQHGASGPRPYPVCDYWVFRGFRGGDRHNRCWGVDHAVIGRSRVSVSDVRGMYARDSPAGGDILG